MAKRLKGLRYRRIDLVDKGANEGALVTLCKRADDNTEEDGMAENAKEPTVEELRKQIETMEADKVKAEADAKEAVEKAQAEADASEGEGKDELKELRKSVKESNDAAKVAIEKAERLETERETNKAISFVKSLGGLAVADDHAEAIRKMRDWDAEVAETIEGLLTKAATAQAAAIKITSGRDGEDGLSVLKAADGFDAVVKKYMTDNKGMTKADAIKAVAATDAGRKLYAESKGE